MATESTVIATEVKELPYSILQSEVLGRYMVAARDVEVGEIIFEEFPLVTGPIEGTELKCPGCSMDATSNCVNCGMPICGADCPHKSIHETNECIPLAQTGQKTGRTMDWVKIYNCLMLHRILALPRNSQDWQTVRQMETHWDKWPINILDREIGPLVQTLREYFNVTQAEYSTEEIYRAQCILYINSFEIRMPTQNVQGLFHLCSILEHNCMPNTHRTVTSQNLGLTVRAAVHIPKGTNLSTSYCDVLWPTGRRNGALEGSKFFTCTCERCSDPTEFGSYLEAFVCPVCPVLAPVVYMSLGLDETLKRIKCTKCGNEWKEKEDGFEGVLEEALHELELLDCDYIKDKIPEFEAWIENFSIFPTQEIIDTLNGGVTQANGPGSAELVPALPKYPKKWVLYPRHFHSWDCMHSLFLTYNYDEDARMDHMEKKILLGKHLLASAENILKGISRFRGTVMYELAMTQFCVLLRRIEDGTEDDSELTGSAKEALANMEEALRNLQYEPEDQPEGEYYKIGVNQLSRLESLLMTILPDLNT